MPAVLLRPLLASLGLCLSLMGGQAIGQTEEQRAEIARITETLAASPVLALGETAIDVAPSTGQFFWLAPQENGIYRLSIDGPGAIRLTTFPNAEGAYDGMTREQVIAEQANTFTGPEIGPFFLAAGWRYLVNVTATGPAMLQLSADEILGAATAPPEKDSTLAPGDYVFALDGTLRLTLDDPDMPLAMTTLAEPRARHQSDVAGNRIVGRLAPFDPNDAARLSLATDVPDGQPPALTFIRIAPFGGDLDETEPNRDTPNTLDLARGFRGLLLPGNDRDRLGFTLDQARSLTISVTTDAIWAAYDVTLERTSDGQRVAVLKRPSRRGALAPTKLDLEAGSYVLELSGNAEGARPVAYSVLVADAPQTDPGAEREPNDDPAVAMPLPADGTLRGNASEGDIDFVRFDIDATDRLWRVFALSVDRVILRDQRGTLADVDAQNGRALADALALPPGSYTVEIRGDGDYALRLMDLGPRPDNYEAEPNNSSVTAQLLTFGQEVSGSFAGAQDVDIFQFRLGAETPTRITISPSEDGPMDAQLYLGNARWGNARDFQPGDGAYSFEERLPAGDWFIQLRARSALTRGTYSVQVARNAQPSTVGSDDSATTAKLMPQDGDQSGVIGAFDAEDHILLRLPDTPTPALIACDAPRWSLWPWSGGRKIANQRDGLMIPDPAEATGGALRVVVSGDTTVAEYRCHQRFRPELADLPPAVQAETAEVITLRAGDHVTGTLTEAAPRQSIALDLAPGTFGAMACVDGSGTAIDPRGWRPRDLALLATDSFDPFVAFRAGAAPGIEMRQASGSNLPQDWRCVVLDTDAMPRLANFASLAPMTIPPDAAPTVPDGAAGAEGTPPSLAALTKLLPPAAQPSGDLPVTISFGSAPALAAYARAGQALALQATLTNNDTVARNLTLSHELAGDRWQAVMAQDNLSLAPGASADVVLDITAPAWLSPVLPAALTLTAIDEDRYASAVAEIAVAADATPTGAFVYHDAPDALRGGLNLLHYGLGARLIAIAGSPVNDRDAEGRAYLHDGTAPHANVREVGRDLIFALPATATVAGAMIQLRSSVNPLKFPTSYEIFHSDDGQNWQRAATGPLSTAMTPQYAVFDTPQETAFIRFRFPDCPPQGCGTIAVSELQAIGVPGQHPPGWPAINAADPTLGGHMVYVTPSHAGDWHRMWLEARPEQRNSGWNIRGDSLRGVIGFHQNRAALIERIAWIGHPDDEHRAPATVDISLQGPAGPWTRIGALTPPAIGEEQASLQLGTPVWARYVRINLDLSGDPKPLGPDAITVIEAPGTSVLGLWEDDQPQGAYEAQIGGEPIAAVPPSGGADAGSAVPLLPDQQVASSVQLERNEDWWEITIPPGPMQEAHFDFRPVPPEVAARLVAADGTAIPLERTQEDTRTRMTALLSAGTYRLRVFEPPRSVVIAWDTSGSVSAYIPRTLAAVRLWSESLVPGRDVLQLLPFATQPTFLLDDWAEQPEDVAPALRSLDTSGSSASETSLAYAADQLARREGARGVVIITDAETGPDAALWPNLLRAQPRVIALSIDSDARQNATIMMDWANTNRGRFQRVVGPVGLADGLDMAAALFRAPKPYDLTLSLATYQEPEGDATITLTPVTPEEDAAPAPSGAVEVILDASGSMLQRLDGRRRIEIAHDALSTLVTDTLPEGLPFAFRAFGLEADACRSELRMPLGPLDRRAASRAIRDVPAINNARTAIAASLTAAAADLADAGDPRVIVLVTDGEETCDGDPAAAIAAIRDSGFDVRVNIVGFAIDDAALAATFAAWAKAGGGAYFEAQDPDALNAAIDSALTPAFGLTRRFVDGTQAAVGQMSPGQTVTVPAGQIAISPQGIAAGEAMTVRLAPGDSLELFYDPVTGLVSD